MIGLWLLLTARLNYALRLSCWQACSWVSLIAILGVLGFMLSWAHTFNTLTSLATLFYYCLRCGHCINSMTLIIRLTKGHCIICRLGSLLTTLTDLFLCRLLWISLMWLRLRLGLRLWLSVCHLWHNLTSLLRFRLYRCLFLNLDFDLVRNLFDLLLKSSLILELFSHRESARKISWRVFDSIKLV